VTNTGFGLAWAHNKIAQPGLDAAKIHSIEFANINFKSTEEIDGNTSRWSQQWSHTIGRTTENKIEHSTIEKVNAHQSWTVYG